MILFSLTVFAVSENFMWVGSFWGRGRCVGLWQLVWGLQSGCGGAGVGAAKPHAAAAAPPSPATARFRVRNCGFAALLMGSFWGGAGGGG